MSRLTRRIAMLPVATGGPPAYDADAAAYFAAMTVQPDATRKGLINDLIVGAKADGVWSPLDWLLLAGHDAQAALVNARQPAKIATVSGALTWTTDRGYQGDGSTGFIDIGEVYNAAGNTYAQNSATVGVWCNLEGGAAGIIPHCGNTGADRNAIRPRNTTGNESFNICDSTGSVFMTNVGSRTGHRTGTRQGATDKRGYFNGGLVATLAISSTAVSATNGTVFRASTLYTADRLPAFYSGEGMTGTQVAAWHARLNTFLTAIGAN